MQRSWKRRLTACREHLFFSYRRTRAIDPNDTATVDFFRVKRDEKDEEDGDGEGWRRFVRGREERARHVLIMPSLLPKRRTSLTKIVPDTFNCYSSYHPVSLADYSPLQTVLGQFLVRVEKLWAPPEYRRLSTFPGLCWFYRFCIIASLSRRPERFVISSFAGPRATSGIRNSGEGASSISRGINAAFQHRRRRLYVLPSIKSSGNLEQWEAVTELGGN